MLSQEIYKVTGIDFIDGWRFAEPSPRRSQRGSNASKSLGRMPHLFEPAMVRNGNCIHTPVGLVFGLCTHADNSGVSYRKLFINDHPRSLSFITRPSATPGAITAPSAASARTQYAELRKFAWVRCVIYRDSIKYRGEKLLASFVTKCTFMDEFRFGKLLFGDLYRPIQLCAVKITFPPCILKISHGSLRKLLNADANSERKTIVFASSPIGQAGDYSNFIDQLAFVACAVFIRGGQILVAWPLPLRSAHDLIDRALRQSKSDFKGISRGHAARFRQEGFDFPVWQLPEKNRAIKFWSDCLTVSMKLGPNFEPAVFDYFGHKFAVSQKDGRIKARSVITLLSLAHICELAAEQHSTVRPVKKCASDLPDQPLLGGLQCILNGVESVIACPVFPWLAISTYRYDAERVITAIRVIPADRYCACGVSGNNFGNNHSAASELPLFFRTAHRSRRLGSCLEPVFGGVKGVLRGVESTLRDPICLSNPAGTYGDELQAPVSSGRIGETYRDCLPVFYRNNFGHHNGRTVAGSPCFHQARRPGVWS